MEYVLASLTTIFVLLFLFRRHIKRAVSGEKKALNPAEMNRIWCKATQESAEKNLRRSLTQDESDKIWNTGSFLQLEQIDMAIYYAKSAVEIEQYLASLSEREPLPEEYTRRE